MLVTANVFQPLIDVFETVLKFFHNSGGISWGWSIVLLTIAVRAILVPLTFRQIKSMVRMQTLAPQMKEIQKKYKEDKQRQQQEMMKFYQENGVNPLSSCLPMVLQLPVFISLYYMLRKSLRNDICHAQQLAFQHAYAVKHGVTLAKAAGQTTACGNSPASHFLFIHDLTAKATGIELGVLIVLYIGSQLGSTLVMSAATMDPTQRKIMMFMPLVFVLFVIRFPAGLLVYWITTNLWTVAQQYVVRRRVGPARAAAVPAVAGAGDIGGTLTGSTSGGGGSPSGGVGGWFREKLMNAQSDAIAARDEKASRSNGGSGAAATKSAPAKRGRSSNGNGDSSGKVSGETASTSRKTARTSSAKPTNGNGSGGNGASASTPPRPPRKKKKRSGRRR